MKRIGCGFFLSVMAIAVMVGPASAGGCASYIRQAYQQTYQPTYQYQAYQQTVYAQVVPVALFQFVQPAAVTTTTTQTTATVGVAPAVAAQAAPAAPSSLLMDAQVKLLAAEIVKGLKAPEAPVDPPARTAPKPADLPPPNPTPMPKVATASGDAASADPLYKVKLTYSVASLSAKNCMSCHMQGVKEGGKVYLFSDKGAFGPNVGMDKIAEAVRSKHMPLKGEMADTDRAVFDQLAALP